MFTLIVNGVPSLKLRSKSDIPPRQGKESWIVVDEHKKMVAYYLAL